MEQLSFFEPANLAQTSVLSPISSADRIKEILSAPVPAESTVSFKRPEIISDDQEIYMPTAKPVNILKRANTVKPVTNSESSKAPEIADSYNSTSIISENSTASVFTADIFNSSKSAEPSFSSVASTTGSYAHGGFQGTVASDPVVASQNLADSSFAEIATFNSLSHSETVTSSFADHPSIDSPEPSPADSSPVDVSIQEAAPKKKGHKAGVPSTKKGESVTVYPIKDKDQLLNTARYLKVNCDPRHVTAFILGCNLGLRINELLNIRVADVLTSDYHIRYSEDKYDTSDAVRVFQSKTGKKRTVFLNKACVEALTWYFEQNGSIRTFASSYTYLFPGFQKNNSKTQMTSEAFRLKLKKATTAVGVKQNIGTHTCRKTFGWWQYILNTKRSYSDLSQLQRLFGHESQETTLRYLGVLDEEDKDLYHSVCLMSMTEIDSDLRSFMS